MAASSPARRALPAAPVLALALAAAAAAGCLGAGRGAAAPEAPAAPGTRPARWARPVSVPGCPNLWRVSAGLYRGAQPTAEGLAGLRRLGVRTVVNLRALHSDRDELAAAGAAAAGLGCERINMKPWHAEDEDAARFLRIAADPARQPVFVHCRDGADRTGTMCAVYRVVVQGWSRQAALEEMVGGGYGFHGVWANLKRYIEGLPAEALRRRAGLDR